MPDGIEARLSRAERDIDDLSRRVTANAEKLAALPFMDKDLDELQRSFERVAKSCENSERLMTRASEGLRQYVEDRLKADAEKAERKRQQARQQETENRRLSLTQLGIIVGAVAVLAAAIISAIASLAAAGVI